MERHNARCPSFHNILEKLSASEMNESCRLNSGSVDTIIKDNYHRKNVEDIAQ